ncbi:MAG: hypothetical protein K2K94_04185, partial [Muribaculaceae bacterium]|nr:hypothetical protein [Muribaculaceae bacterium]
MKKIIFTLVALLSIAVMGSNARIWNPKGMTQPDRVVFNPDFMAETSGSLKIDRIEFFKDSTLIVFTANCPHYRSIKVDRNLTLEVDGNVLLPTKVYGMKFGEVYTLPRWGKQQFILVYPPVGRKVERMSIVELGGSWNIYGIRLDGGSYNRPTIKEWLETKLAYYSGESKQFIYPEPKTVIFEGFINGYDPNVFKRSFRLNNYNEITGIEEPIDVPIEDDGSFKLELKTYFPKFVIADFPLDMPVKSYLEPGHNLSIYFDRNMILGQRAGNINVWDAAIVNGGDLGIINNQLYASWAVWTPQIMAPLYNVKSLNDAQKIIKRLHKEQVEKLKSYAHDFMIFPYSEAVILANEKAGMIEALLQQEKMFKQRNGDNVDIPDGFYDFIKNDLNDNLIVTSGYFPSVARLLSESRYREVLGINNIYS